MSARIGKKKKNSEARSKTFWVVVGIVVVLVIIGIDAVIAFGRGSKTAAAPASSASVTPAASSPSVAASTAPTPSLAPGVLLDLTGTGVKSTHKFTANGDWDLDWSYDCSNLGKPSTFQVFIYNDDGSPSTDNDSVSESGTSGADVEHYTTSGSFFLEVDSACTWHVTAKG